MNIKNSKDSTKSMALKIKKFLLCSGMVLGWGLLSGCGSSASESEIQLGYKKLII